MRTKKISKTVSLDNEVWKKLINYCEENSINRSALVQKLVVQHLKEKGIN